MQNCVSKDVANQPHIHDEITYETHNYNYVASYE